jgi:asparagine synthetase A
MAYLTKLMMNENFKKHERTLPRKPKFTKTAVFVQRVQKREAFERESKFCKMMCSTFMMGPAEMMPPVQGLMGWRHRAKGIVK